MILFVYTLFFLCFWFLGLHEIRNELASMQTAEEEALQRKGEEEMRQLIIALPDFVPRPKGYAIEATIVEDEGSAQKKDDEVVGDASSANQEDVPMQEGGIKRGERSKRKAVAMPGSDEEVQEIEVDYSVARKRIRISGQKAPQLSPHPLLRQALEAAEKMRPCDTHVMDSLFDRYAEGRETDDAKLRRLMILLMAKYVHGINRARVAFTDW